MAVRKRVKRERLLSIGWDAPAWERMLHDERVRARTVLADAEESIGRTVANTMIGLAGEEPTRNADGSKVHPMQPDPVQVSPSVAEGIADNASMATKLLGRGLFSALYGMPQTHDRGPAWAQIVSQALEQTPGFLELGEVVGLDPDAVGIATTKLFRDIEEQIPNLLRRLWEQGQNPGDAPQKPQSEEPCDSEQQGPGQNNQGQGQGGEQGDEGQQPGGPSGGQPGDQPGQGSGQGHGPQQGPTEAAAQELAQALGESVRDALREASEAKAALNSLLPGLGAPPPRHQQQSPLRMQMVERLGADKRLQKILRMAGRISRIADRVRKQRTSEIPEEIVGISTGDEIPALLSSEVMGLFDEDLQTLQLARLADKQMLQFEREGTERIGRGPIVALLDVSGSMAMPLADGLRRIDWASVIGVAAVQSAFLQNRHVKVGTFNGRLQETWSIDPAKRTEAREALLQIATLDCGGGTAFDGPICWALDAGAVEDRADLMIVTDGAGYVDNHTMSRLNEAKERGLRVWGVVAGDGEFDERTLGTLCDGIIVMGDDEDADYSQRLGELAV